MVNELEEKIVAEQVGLPRTTIRSLRGKLLEEGEDWRRGEAGVVIYTASGLKKLAANLDDAPGAKIWRDMPDRPDDPFRPEKDDGATRREAGGAENELGLVEEWRFKNSRVIRVRRSGGELVNVRVHSNQNYRRGMSVKIRPSGPGWIIVGRSPRWPGRW